jgi:hypothetical protein
MTRYRMTGEAARSNALAWLAVENVRAAERMGIDVPNDIREAAIQRYLASPLAMPGEAYDAVPGRKAYERGTSHADPQRNGPTPRAGGARTRGNDQ